LSLSPAMSARLQAKIEQNTVAVEGVSRSLAVLEARLGDRLAKLEDSAVAGLALEALLRERGWDAFRADTVSQIAELSDRMQALEELGRRADFGREPEVRGGALAPMPSPQCAGDADAAPEEVFEEVEEGGYQVWSDVTPRAPSDAGKCVEATTTEAGAGDESPSARLSSSRSEKTVVEQLCSERGDASSLLPDISPVSRGAGVRRSMNRASFSVQFDTITTLSRESAKYSLKESVWDVSLFTGYARLGLWSNILLAASLLLNITVQVSLCAIVATELSFDPFDDNFIQGLHKWRQNVSETVATQICEEDYTISTDTLQLQTFETTRDFLSPGMFQSLETGPLLASIVIFMWTLSVAEVLRGAINYLMAAWHLRLKYSSETFTIVQAGDSFCIMGVTTFRIWWAILVGVMQIGIAFCLLLSGALWLAYTKSIPDLLANAVALSYVMQVDELLYQVMIPRKVKAVVTNLEPIDMSKHVAKKLPSGVPKNALLTVLFTFAFFGTIVGACVVPHAFKMRELRDNICPQESAA